MKKQLIQSLIFLSILLGFFHSCAKISVPKDTPSCIKNKIRKIQGQHVFNPPASVSLWEFDGKKYYYITSDCCDQMTELYNDQCELICHPDGGITGTGDGKCPDFTQGTLQKTLIWKDSRK
jgi:hypothetical protein